MDPLSEPHGPPGVRGPQFGKRWIIHYRPGIRTQVKEAKAYTCCRATYMKTNLNLL